MKARITQLKSRYQNYSAREKVILKTGVAAICSAVIYYAGVLPLDNMIKDSQSVLTRQTETLNWMKAEIDKNHLPVQKIKTDNPRSVVENSAHEINLTLTDVRQDGQTLMFSVNRINVYELKNWLREINLASGIRLEKMNLTPVDHLNDVKAEIQLTWKKTV